MSAATQIYYTPFDSAFFKLPAEVRARIEGKIDEMGLRLKIFPHQRLKVTTATGFVWEIIESSTHSTRRKMSSTCSVSAIERKFTVTFESPESARGLAHSKTLREFRTSPANASHVECGTLRRFFLVSRQSSRVNAELRAFSPRHPDITMRPLKFSEPKKVGASTHCSWQTVFLNTGLQPGEARWRRPKPFQRFVQGQKAVETALTVALWRHLAEARC